MYLRAFLIQRNRNLFENRYLISQLPVFLEQCDGSVHCLLKESSSQVRHYCLHFSKDNTIVLQQVELELGAQLAEEQLWRLVDVQLKMSGNTAECFTLTFVWRLALIDQEPQQTFRLIITLPRQNMQGRYKNGEQHNLPRGSELECGSSCCTRMGHNVLCPLAVSCWRPTITVHTLRFAVFLQSREEDIPPQSNRDGYGKNTGERAWENLYTAALH